MGQAQAGELPACGGWKEVSVSGADVGGGCDAGASAEDHLSGHEFAVVFADGAGSGLEAGIAEVGAGGPLPGVAEELGGIGGELGRAGSGVQAVGFEEVSGDGGGGCGEFPLKFGGEPESAPACVGVGFIEADVGDGGGEEIGEGNGAAEGEDGPLAGIVLRPVERSGPLEGVDGDPAIGEPEFGAAVSAVKDELEVFGAGDGVGSEVEGLEKDFVAGEFVVEGEAWAGVACLVDAAWEFVPVERLSQGG